MKKNKYVKCSAFKLIMGFEYKEQCENYHRRLNNDYLFSKKWNNQLKTNQQIEINKYGQ